MCYVYEEAKNFEEVMLLPELEKKQLEQAMKEELKSMDEHGVFTETKLPPQHNGSIKEKYKTMVITGTKQD